MLHHNPWILRHNLAAELANVVLIRYLYQVPSGVLAHTCFALFLMIFGVKDCSETVEAICTHVLSLATEEGLGHGETALPL